MSVTARLQETLAAIEAAAAAAGRDSRSVQLIAVSKTHPLAAVQEAYDAGARDFGENSAQELQTKASGLAASGRLGARWHFVGRLQRNKVASVSAHAYRIHSIDRLELVTALARRSASRSLPVLLQVNVGKEAQKGGVAPEELLDLAGQIGRYATVQVVGLMAVPPAARDPTPYFRQLAALLRKLRHDGEHAAATELSIGMSHDFALAIACGATWVRIGTAIFGARNYG